MRPTPGPAQREALKLRIKQRWLCQTVLLEFEAFAAQLVTIATINHKHNPAPNRINTTPYTKRSRRRKGMPFP